MRTYFLIAVFFTILTFAPISKACTCGGLPSGNPACQAYWYTPVIFSGKAVQIEPDGGDSGIGGGFDNHVQFAIDESFKGISGATAEVSTPRDSAACGYPFKVGESYMVYAYQDKDGKLSVGLCGRTIPMSGAAEDIAYFKSIPTLKPLGTIGGIIYDVGPRKENEVRAPPIQALKVTAEGPKGTVETRTDESGKYRFADLEPGEYLVKLSAPKGFFPLIDEHKVKVIAKGCSFYDGVFARNTVISGRVTDEDGKPASKLLASLVPANTIDDKTQKDNLFVEIDELGNYIFRSIPAGRYYVGFRLDGISGDNSAYPRTFYPGTQNIAEAAVIAIADGESIDGLNFQLPKKLASRKIEGVVVYPDGKPARNPYICFEVAEYLTGAICSPANGEISKDGHFSFTRLDGLKYRIHVHVDLPGSQYLHAKPVEIPANGAVSNLKLVLSEPGGW